LSSFFNSFFNVGWDIFIFGNRLKLQLKAGHRIDKSIGIPTTRFIPMLLLIFDPSVT